MEILSLRQLKKKIAIGDTVITTYHLKHKESIDSITNLYQDEVRPPREVVECNTNSFTLASLEEGEWVGRKITYPSASRCQIEDGKLVIMGNDFNNPDNKQLIRWITIQLIQAKENL